MTYTGTAIIKKLISFIFGSPYWNNKRQGVFIPVINKFLDADDLYGGQMTWQEAMGAAAVKGKSLPTRFEALIINFFIKEINQIITSHGGKPIDRMYWLRNEKSEREACVMVLTNTGMFMTWNSKRQLLTYARTLSE